MYFMALMLGASIPMLAQSDGILIPPPPPPPTPPPPPGLPLPIDSDITVLLVLGVVLGIYVAYRKRLNY